MRLNLWKVFCASICLLFLAPIQISKGCSGGYDEYDETGGRFYPDYKIFPTNPYLDFNFSYHSFSEVPEAAREDLNIAHWQEYFGEYWSTQQLKQIIYRSDKKTIVKLRDQIVNLQEMDSTTEVFARLYNRKYVDFLGYLIYAKNCEPQVDYTSMDWDSPNRDLAVIDELIATGKANFQETKNPFLKNRYAYQIIRLYHYSDQYEKCIEAFDKYWEKGAKDDLMYYWSLSLKAGALNRLNKNVEASYLFSKVFMSHTGRSVQAKRGINIENQLEWDSVLTYCKTDSEQANLWFIEALGVHERSLPAMKAIWSLNKNEEQILHLLGRDFARMGDLQSISSYIDENFNYEKEYYLELTSFITNDVLSEELQYNAEWQFSLGYLNYLRNSYPSAFSSFDEMRKTINNTSIENSEILLQQAAILEIIMKYKGQDPIDNDEIVKDLNELEKKSRNEEYKMAYNYLLGIAVRRNAGKLGEAMDLVMSVVNRTEYYCSYLEANPHNMKLDQLIGFNLKPNKSEIESYFSDRFKYTLADLYHLKGITKFVENDMDSALFYLKLAENSGANSIGRYNSRADIESFRIRDCHDCDYELPNKNKVNLKQALVRIEELESELNSPSISSEVKAEKAILIGNIYYNLTHFGNCWYLLDFEFQGKYYDEQETNDQANIAYGDCSNSYDYYQKAFKFTSNKETKAKALYLMAKCEQNDFYTSRHQTYSSWGMDDFIELKNESYRSNFTKLIQNYSETDFYAKSLNECGYLGSFAEHGSQH